MPSQTPDQKPETVTQQETGGNCVSRIVRHSWFQKVMHRNLGECIINMECLAMQTRNADPSSIFVEHDGDIKEVSRSMISQPTADVLAPAGAKLTTKPQDD